ncbi:MAG: hypothetical protein ACYDB1_12560 [Acidiferrobacteraceae bacterium]
MKKLALVCCLGLAAMLYAPAPASAIVICTDYTGASYTVGGIVCHQQWSLCNNNGTISVSQIFTSCAG